MESSPRLSLPYLAPQQAQKHVTVNESVRRLDALVGLAVLSRTTDAEPADPGEGDAYLITAGATGDAWSAFAENTIAAFQDGAWAEIAPQTGLRAYIVDEAGLAVFDGAAWTGVGGSESAPKFGVNTLADATNRLAVKANAALFSHDDVTPGSGDMRCLVNKSAVAKTASVLFQTAFSGRAEFGLVGDDDFHMKVSPDGAAFHEGVKIRGSDGKVSFPSGLLAPLAVAQGGTGGATLTEAFGALGFRKSLTGINDNAVAIGDFGGAIYGAAILAVPNSTTSGPCALFFTRMAPSPAMSTIVSAGASFTIGTGALSGTTGPDNSTNFSVTSDGKFYVENRRGFAIAYTLFIFM